MAGKSVIRSFTVSGGRKVVSVKPTAMHTAIKAAMSTKTTKHASSKTTDRKRDARS